MISTDPLTRRLIPQAPTGLGATRDCHRGLLGALVAQMGCGGGGGTGTPVAPSGTGPQTTTASLPTELTVPVRGPD